MGHGQKNISDRSFRSASPACLIDATMMIESFKDLSSEVAERFQFEALLANLSARFINLPADQVDGAIEAAQRQVCECLAFDVCSLWQLSADQPDTLLLTHYHVPRDFLPVPEAMNAQDVSPWSLEKVRRNETIVVARLTDTPPAAERDRALWQHYGMRSLLTFPLSVGGEATFGALHFAVIREEREWSPDLVGRLRLVAQVFANTLARKWTDQALREGEERLNLATAAADAGLWVLNETGTTFWINAKITAMFGLPPADEIPVDRFIALVHPEDQNRVQKVLTHALDTLDMTAVEYRVVHPDGSIRWMQSRGRLCRPARGGTDRLMGITADITERKRTELEANELRGELAHVTRLSTMGELAASLAHEVNQPLAAILSNAQAARRFLAAPDADMNAIRDILDDIVRDDKRASAVIQRLRAMVRKDMANTAERVSLNDLVREVEQLLNSELIGRSVETELRLSPTLPPVFANSVEMQQVLLNLMLNAMDAMQDQPAGQRRITIETVAENKSARVRVHDTGPGIPLEVMADVFRPFFTTKQHGLGMGLAVCRSIIENHGGRLWMENPTGGGALFQFEIPAAQELPAT